MDLHPTREYRIRLLQEVGSVLQVLHELPEGVGLGLDFLRRRLRHGCCLMVSTAERLTNRPVAASFDARCVLLGQKKAREHELAG